MANRSIFTKAVNKAIKPVNTVNYAGGKAYLPSDEHILAQGVVTSCFGQTYYMSEKDQLDRILELSRGCRPEFVAKACVYAHEVAHMKDTPALLLAVLMSRGKIPDGSDPNVKPTEDQRKCNLLFQQVFPRVITNVKMLCGFTQIVRSGVTGISSFGGTGKTMVRQWLANHEAGWLFRGQVGHANPSLAQIIGLVHPSPDNDEKRALYGYLRGSSFDGKIGYNPENLPSLVKEYENFKKDKVGIPPNVPFQLLATLGLNPDQWRHLARGLPWNALRMNLNTLARHGCFSDQCLVDEVARKIANPEEVRRNNAFPYQLLISYLNVDASIPMRVKNSLQDAMEIATENVPTFEGGVAVCIDSSGSMCSAVTGSRKGSTSVATCRNVAALVGASIARKNGETMLIPFDTRVHDSSSLNPRDSVMTNAEKLSRFPAGGTDCACALRHLNLLLGNRPRTVIFVSDNESWFNADGGGRYNRGTGMAHEWQIYRGKTPGAKLVCIDLVANNTVQAVDSNDVLNLGGFSDSMWGIIDKFVRGSQENFVGTIEGVNLVENRVIITDPPTLDDIIDS